ncbi:MAG: YraN family protein [Desulfovibrio sp.]
MPSFLKSFKAAHLNTGESGEDVAEAYLKKKGMRVLCRNWRKRQLEIDIICQHKDTIVFVEVKTRKSAKRGSPVEAVGLSKQKKLIRAASFFLSDEGAWDAPCRFDVVGVVLLPDGKVDVTHIADAFQAGTAGWQPW